MRVTIEHKEIAGGFFGGKRYHRVLVGIEFTEVERAIIKNNNLSNDHMYEFFGKGWPKTPHGLGVTRLGQMMHTKPYPFDFQTRDAAMIFEPDITHSLELLSKQLKRLEKPSEKKTLDL